MHADDKTGSLLQAVTTLKSSLAEMIEPDFGLLDRLLATKVLTRRQIASVRAERTVYNRNDTLLDLLTGEAQCKEFLKALQRTDQTHVVNYITQRGGQKHNETHLSTVAQNGKTSNDIIPHLSRLEMV